jgi:hypothetical protein
MNDVPRTRTLTERLGYFGRRHTSKRPFTADEIALAQAIAEAWYFSNLVAELPSRCPEGSQACVALDWGILKVLQRRGDIELTQSFP